MKFPIETGRWIGVKRKDRMCSLCNNYIVDESLYVFKCTDVRMVQLREKFIPLYYRKNPSVIKMNGILSGGNKTLLNNFCLLLNSLNKVL